MTVWEILKNTSKILLIEEIFAFLLSMAGICGFLLITFASIGG